MVPLSTTHYLIVEEKRPVEPWMIKKIEEESRKSAQSRRIQPNIPAPPPISIDRAEKSGRPSREEVATNISFEV